MVQIKIKWFSSGTHFSFMPCENMLDNSLRYSNFPAPFYLSTHLYVCSRTLQRETMVCTCLNHILVPSTAYHLSQETMENFIRVATMER